MATPASTSLLNTLGLDALAPAEQEEMLLTLSNLVFRGAMVRFVERMDDKAREDFTKLMEQGADGASVESFLRERVPGADGAVQETIDEIAADMATLAIPAA